MKRTFVLCMTLVMLFSVLLTGCARRSAADDGRLRILVVAKDLADPYSQWLINMAEKRLREEYPDVFFRVVDQMGDPANSQPIVDQAILEGFDALLLQKVSGSQNTDAMFQDAARQGLYTVIMNNDVNDGVTSSSFAPEYAMGYMIGAEAAKNLPQNARVVVLMSTPALFSSEQRRMGYEDSLFKVRPDITILDTRNIESWRKEIAIQVMEDWCQRFPQIDGVISMNDGMVLGAIEAAKADRRDVQRMQFYGIDGLADGCLSIMEGEQTASILQDAVDMAYNGADIAVRIAKGELRTPIKYEITPLLITGDNIDTFIQLHRDTGVIR